MFTRLRETLGPPRRWPGERRRWRGGSPGRGRGRHRGPWGPRRRPEGRDPSNRKGPTHPRSGMLLGGGGPGLGVDLPPRWEGDGGQPPLEGLIAPSALLISHFSRVRPFPLLYLSHLIPGRGFGPLNPLVVRPLLPYPAAGVEPSCARSWANHPRFL